MWSAIVATSTSVPLNLTPHFLPPLNVGRLGKLVQCAQLMRSFSLFSVVRCISFSAGLRYLTKLTIQLDRKYQFKIESRKRKHSNMTVATHNHYKLCHLIIKKENVTATWTQLLSTRNCCYNAASEYCHYSHKILLNVTTDSILAFHTLIKLQSTGN